MPTLKRVFGEEEAEDVLGREEKDQVWETERSEKSSATEVEPQKYERKPIEKALTEKDLLTLGEQRKTLIIEDENGDEYRFLFTVNKHKVSESDNGLSAFMWRNDASINEGNPVSLYYIHGIAPATTLRIAPNLGDASSAITINIPTENGLFSEEKT